MIEHPDINLAVIRQCPNQGDRRWGKSEIAARMRTPRRFCGLALIDAVDDAHARSAIDESPDADRDLGLAILAAHQKMGLAVARWKGCGHEGCVVERGLFVGGHPRRIAALLTLCRPAWRGRGRYIEAVIAFQPLRVVLDLTAKLDGVLGLRARGENDTGASDDQYGAHSRIRADRVSVSKTAQTG